MINVNVFAGDLRQHYIVKHLEKHRIPTNYVYSFKTSNAYVLPIPFSKDGSNINSLFKEQLSIDRFKSAILPGDLIFSCNIPKHFMDYCNNIKATCIDYMSDPEFVAANSYLTAEGLLSEIINTTPFSIKNKKILIIGYGKCGIAIADILKNFTQDIYIYDHTDIHMKNADNNGYYPVYYRELLSKMSDFNVIINTVPDIVLTSIHLNEASNECIFYEIASFPFGFDTKVFEEHNKRLITCPGIPGKYSPETAGEYISKIIIKHLERNDINGVQPKR